MSEMASDTLDLESQLVVRYRICILETEPRSFGRTIPSASNFMMILIKSMIETGIEESRKTNMSSKVEKYLFLSSSKNRQGSLYYYSKNGWHIFYYYYKNFLYKKKMEKVFLSVIQRN